MTEHNSPPHEEPANEDKRWLDEPKNVTKLVYGLAVLCALTVLADFIWARHGHFDIEETPGFFAIYGFISYCFIVLSAKQLRRLLKRDENYYD